MWGWDGWWGGGIGGLWHLMVSIFFGFGQLLALLILAGVLVLLVRFLLVGTRAAQLYIAKNGPATPAASTEATTAPGANAPASAPTTRTTTRTAPTTRTAATKPASTTTRTTKRTPKPPTAPPAPSA
jgi:cytoskeletal protein RodZ